MYLIKLAFKIWSKHSVFHFIVPVNHENEEWRYYYHYSPELFDLLLLYVHENLMHIKVVVYQVRYGIPYIVVKFIPTYKRSYLNLYELQDFKKYYCSSVSLNSYLILESMSNNEL